MQHKELVAATHAEMLLSRNVHYIICSETFEMVYVKASDEQKIIVHSHIHNRDVDAIRYWMAGQRKQRYEEMTTVALRKEAQRRRISDYNWMNKPELIVELKYDDAARASDIARKNDNTCDTKDT